jgi:maleate isomerase
LSASLPFNTVLAINTCVYWWSLRQNGIDDRIAGFGSLLLEH